MPQPRKPADRRQRTVTKDLGKVTALPAVRQRGLAELVDPAWPAAVQAEWVELAQSPIAAHFRDTDQPALRRLFDYRAALERARIAFEVEPTSVGSTGQPVLSPWAAEIHRIESQIQKLEDRFGLTPLSRLRLGVIVEEGVSLAARNQQLLEAFRQSAG